MRDGASAWKIISNCFSATMHFGVLLNVTFVLLNYYFGVSVDDSRLSMAAQQHWIAETPSDQPLKRMWNWRVLPLRSDVKFSAPL
jgi:hypothetical protein